jgi:hypothetical protein
MTATVPMLIDQIRDLPKKEGYTTVSVKESYLEKPFNGIEGMVTRKIRISGVRLVWDEYVTPDPGGDDDEVSKRLFNYSGSNDIELLEMYADEVVIKSPLAFPQTEVWICARKLIFERNGSITTTPLAYPTSAYTLRRDATARPLNAQGQIAAKDGAKGLPGGNITLCLPERGNIRVPAPDDLKTKRFITVGGRGQDGEDGGYLDYVAKPGQQQQPGDQTYMTTFKSDSVEGLLSHPGNWRFPANWKDDLENFRVFHVQLELFNDTAFTAVTNPKAVHTSTDSGGRVWPGGVPDAFPSGKGGDGGLGGEVRRFWEMFSVIPERDTAANERNIADIIDNAGGAPGTSKAMPARQPIHATDSTTPPAFMRMNLVLKSPPVESNPGSV